MFLIEHVMVQMTENELFVTFRTYFILISMVKQPDNCVLSTQVKEIS